ncbi:MAG: ABC transporter permease [Ilumatobacteraceae bacterium]
MMNLLRSEWIKLRTVTMHWVLSIIALAFPLVVTLLTAYFNGDSNEFSANDLISVLTGSTVVSSLLCGALAAASITGEFGFGTIRPTFAATPNRWKVVVAKGIVVVGFTIALAAVVQLVGWYVGGPIAEARGATIDLGEVPTGVPAMVGAVLLTALMTLAGYGLGLLTRSTAVAVAVLIVWPLIAEGLVGQLIVLATDNEKIRNWMPFQAGIRLAIVDTFGDGGPSRLAAGIYFGAFTMALTAIGAWLVNRRDA